MWKWRKVTDVLKIKHKILRKQWTNQNQEKSKTIASGLGRVKNDNALVTTEVSGTDSTCQTKNNPIALTFIHSC